jgi:hypothetical protein
MQTDEMTRAWAVHGANLERSLAINERLLREKLLRKLKTGLARSIMSRTVEVAIGLGTILAIMSVLAAHVAEPRYAIVAGGLAVLTAWVTALCAYALVQSITLDYGNPVTTLQRGIERIRLAEYRALKWAVLGGIVGWLPAALVLFEALTGVDALARVKLGWLIANLVFGLVCLGLGLALSRRYVERSDVGPRAHRLMEALSGRGVRSAAGHLAELASFERDEPLAPTTT